MNVDILAERCVLMNIAQAVVLCLFI